MARRLRKQRRTLAVEAFGIGRNLVLEIGVRLDYRKALARGQMIEPIAQGADRLRRIRSVGRFVRHFWRGISCLVVGRRCSIVRA